MWLRKDVDITIQPASAVKNENGYESGEACWLWRGLRSMSIKGGLEGGSR